MNRIRSTLAKLAAIGAVKRKGVGGLKAYGGKVEGKGVVKHKDGGSTEFTMTGEPAAKP